MSRIVVSFADLLQIGTVFFLTVAALQKSDEFRLLDDDRIGDLFPYIHTIILPFLCYDFKRVRFFNEKFGRSDQRTRCGREGIPG